MIFLKTPHLIPCLEHKSDRPRASYELAGVHPLVTDVPTQDFLIAAAWFQHGHAAVPAKGAFYLKPALREENPTAFDSPLPTLTVWNGV